MYPEVLRGRRGELAAAVGLRGEGADVRADAEVDGADVAVQRVGAGGAVIALIAAGKREKKTFVLENLSDFFIAFVDLFLGLLKMLCQVAT